MKKIIIFILSIIFIFVFSFFASAAEPDYNNSVGISYNGSMEFISANWNGDNTWENYINNYQFSDGCPFTIVNDRVFYKDRPIKDYNNNYVLKTDNVIHAAAKTYTTIPLYAFYENSSYMKIQVPFFETDWWTFYELVKKAGNEDFYLGGSYGTYFIYYKSKLISYANDTCKYGVQYDIGDVCSHIWRLNEIKIEANCQNEGIYNEVCANCGLISEDKSLPLDMYRHTKPQSDYQEPTCTSYGYIREYCLDCNYSSTTKIEMLPHDFEGVTCSIKSKCSMCHKIGDYDVNNHVNIQARTCENDEMCLDCNLVFQLANWYEKQRNLFGYIKLDIEIQLGTLEGQIKTDYWRILFKKDISNRYKTDCLQAVFNNPRNKVYSIDEFETYSSIVANNQELAAQRSYFQNDIRKIT